MNVHNDIIRKMYELSENIRKYGHVQEKEEELQQIIIELYEELVEYEGKNKTPEEEKEALKRWINGEKTPT